MKTNIIIGNWKLNGNKNLIDILIKNINDIELNNKLVVIMPSFIYMDYLYNKIKNIKKNIFLGSQNVDFNINGSFTGEISSEMLKDIGVKYVMIGHYERRKFHNENDNYICKKFLSIKNFNMIPILCIGENKNEYINNNSSKFCLNQIKNIIHNINHILFKDIYIAYEPIWSIGTGEYAKKNHIENIFLNIIEYLYKINIDYIKNNINFIYGGSISIQNIKEISKIKYINGILVGKSSLNPIEFKNIINLYKNN